MFSERARTVISTMLGIVSPAYNVYTAVVELDSENVGVLVHLPVFA